jgi:type II secretory ATPase GspE/PulE/Tfp pilus assembly ATPase PilB-like protein
MMEGPGTMLAASDRQTLGQILIHRGVVTPEHVERALEEQRRGSHQKLLGEILIDLRICQDDHIAEALAHAYDAPFARLNPGLADPNVLKLLPREFLERHGVLPLFLVEGTLSVAVPEPANLFLIEEIERLTGHSVQIVVATERDIRVTHHALAISGRGNGNASSFIIEDPRVQDLRPDQFSILAAPDQSTAPDIDPQVARLVDSCLYHAARQRATDIHIEPGDHALRIRYRIDGRLTEGLRPPAQMADAVTARLKTLAGLDADHRRLPQEGCIRALFEGRPLDLRLSTMPGRFGEKAVIRIIDNEKPIATLEKLGFGYDTLKQWRKLLNLPSGLLLVTGAAGSGKTATLYASLQERNAPDANVCSVEDPVLHPLHGVNQFQVDERLGFDFPTALRALLTQGPDIIMIGDLRDTQTARLAIQAALTGRLVLAALHTPDAPSAVTRLSHLGIEPYLVGASLAGVLAQRLVRKLCPACKEPYAPTHGERRTLDRFDGGATDTLFRPKGCPRCRNLGYHGRLGIYELFAPDEALCERIGQGIQLTEIRDAARARGLKPLRADGIEKVKAGMTTLEEVYRVTA